MGAEALDAADHGRTGEPLGAHPLDDRLVERLAPCTVGLADEDPQQLALALELHTLLPSDDAEVDGPGQRRSCRAGSPPRADRAVLEQS